MEYHKIEDVYPERRIRRIFRNSAAESVLSADCERRGLSGVLFPAHRAEVSLASTRGNIYDRDGEVLAYSELSYSVTILDNGSYPNNRTKNAQLNETIYKLIKLIEKNGDRVVSDLGIVYQNGKYEYSLTGTSLLRLKADVYGKTQISSLEPSEELASADTLMEYLCSDDKYDIRSSYTEEEKEEYGISVDGYTPEEQLQIATIRFGISANSYKRYVTTTVAVDVSEETVAAVLENQNELQGADIEQTQPESLSGQRVFFLHHRLYRKGLRRGAGEPAGGKRGLRAQRYRRKGWYRAVYGERSFRAPRATRRCMWTAWAGCWRWRSSRIPSRATTST